MAEHRGVAGDVAASALARRVRDRGDAEPAATTPPWCETAEGTLWVHDYATSLETMSGRHYRECGRCSYLLPVRGTTRPGR